MQITRKRLRQIILEEIDNASEEEPHSPFTSWRLSSRSPGKEQWPFNRMKEDLDSFMRSASEDSDEHEMLRSKWKDDLEEVAQFQQDSSDMGDLVDPEGFQKYMKEWADKYNEQIPPEFYEMVDAQRTYLDEKDQSVTADIPPSPAHTARAFEPGEPSPSLVRERHVVSDFGADDKGAYAIVITNENAADNYYETTGKYLSPSAVIYRNGDRYRSLVTHGSGPWGEVEIIPDAESFRIYYKSGDSVQLEYDPVGG